MLYETYSAVEPMISQTMALSQIGKSSMRHSSMHQLSTRRVAAEYISCRNLLGVESENRRKNSDKKHVMHLMKFEVALKAWRTESR
jgi:hypothetical protein